MYFLVPLLAPLVLLGVMGMAWIEDHLLPPAEPSPQARTLTVLAPDPPSAEPPELPQRPQAFPGCLRDPAPGLRAAARGGQGDAPPSPGPGVPPGSAGARNGRRDRAGPPHLPH